MKVQRTLHPKGFKVNEAWVAFRINSLPVRTEEDGDFDCLALMDAASCYILGMEMVPLQDPGASAASLVRLLQNGEAQSGCLPGTLYLGGHDHSVALAHAVGGRVGEVISVPESALTGIIGEAKREFSERFETTLQ